MTARRSRPSTLRPLLIAVGSLLAGGIVGFVAATLLGGSGSGAASPGDGIQLLELVVLGVVLVPSALLVIAVHEAGHVAGGWIAGFDFQLFIVGPLQLRRTDAGLRVEWNRSVAMAGGLAMSSPPPGDTERLVSRMIRVVAGGPVASLLLGLLGLYGMSLLPDGLAASSLTGLVATSLTAMLGIGSLGVAVVTLIPARTGGFLSDGARLVRLLRGGTEADGEAAMLGLIGASMGGVRPRDWPIALLESAARLRDPVFRSTATWYRWLNALDRGVGEEAELRREAIAGLEVIPVAARAGLALPLVGRLADVGELSEARTLYDSVDPSRSIVDPYEAPLAEAALRIAEGEVETARRLLARARTALAAATDPLARRMAEERIRILERRLTPEAAP